MFGGWLSWVISFWLVKVRHVPVAAAAGAVATVVQVVLVRPMFSLACRCSLMAWPRWKIAMVGYAILVWRDWEAN